MKIWAYLDGEDNVNVCQLSKLLDKTGSLRQAMKQLKEQR